MTEYVTKFEQAMNDYISNLQAIGTSEKTTTNYKKRLSAFLEFWKTTSPECDPSVADVRAWRDHLLNAGLKASSVKQYLCELSYFFSALSDGALDGERVYNSNPVSHRLYPKVEKRPYDRLMSDEDVAKLWKNEVQSKRRGDLWARNYAIVVLLLTSEIRNAELLNLTLNDIDLNYGEITIERGKGGKFRVVDIPEIAVTAIQLYLASGIRPNDATENDVLFGTCADENGHNTASWHRGSSQWLSSIVERHVKAVTGVPNIRTHDLRHLGARLDLNAGLRAEALQSKLGHSSITTTQIYSDRLMQRRGRESAQAVYAERDKQTEINNIKLRLKIASA